MVSILFKSSNLRNKRPFCSAYLGAGASGAVKENKSVWIWSARRFSCLKFLWKLTAWAASPINTILPLPNTHWSSSSRSFRTHLDGFSFISAMVFLTVGSNSAKAACTSSRVPVELQLSLASVSFEYTKPTIFKTVFLLMGNTRKCLSGPSQLAE